MGDPYGDEILEVYKISSLTIETKDGPRNQRDCSCPAWKYPCKHLMMLKNLEKILGKDPMQIDGAVWDQSTQDIVKPTNQEG